MKLIVLTQNNPDVDRAPYVDDEYRMIDELQAAGVIERIFLRLDKTGSVVLCDDDSSESLRARFSKLPFFQHDCVRVVDLIEVSERV
jgi:muconolactone delta-isomerase